MERIMGFEPMTFSLATRRSTTELHHPLIVIIFCFGHTGENRTHIKGFAILRVTIPPRCVGSPGGSRTRRTTILSCVRIPVPSPGLNILFYKIFSKMSTSNQLSYQIIFYGTFLIISSNSGGKCDT